MAITAEEFIELKREHLLDRSVIAKDIGRKGRLLWRRVGVTLRQQTNDPHKVFLIERLQLEGIEGERLRGGPDVGAVQYRFGYYIVSRSDQWWWGQYSPFIPEEDLLPLLDEARSD